MASSIHKKYFEYHGSTALPNVSDEYISILLPDASRTSTSKKGAAIINTASITAYQGNKELIDYSSTKGAIVSFTRSLALSLVDSGIRVNSVAPGPVWTPLIPSSYSADEVSVFGTDTPFKRAAQPYELAGAYLYLAGPDSSYVTGTCIHVNGGDMVTS